MDSLTHLFIGGAIAAAIAPPAQRRAALLAGAALNTLPDLDVLPLLLSDDPVVRMTWHRGATHSLLVLPWIGWLLWAWFRGRGGRVAAAPRRWFWLFQATLLAHPVLDAFTVYGTQLLWPLPLRPVMWSSLFIIDPLFTLPLVLGCAIAWFARGPRGGQALALGLGLCGAYLGWSLLAKTLVDRAADRALVQMGLRGAPRFSVPMPFNTLLWRVVAMTPDGFVEGERSLVADRGPMHFTRHRGDPRALAVARDIPSGSRLLWFNHHFAKAEVVDGHLLLTDLRMGAEPDYTFRFVIARREGARWHAVAPRQLRWPWDARDRLAGVWVRLWNDPAHTGGGARPSAPAPSP